MIDYRDLDDEPSDNGGAEIPQYSAAGPNRLPANAPFERIDELQNVLDVTPAQVRQLRPYLTVHNPDGKIAVLEASVATLRLIPGGARLADQIPALKAAAQTERQNEGQSDAVERLLGDAAKFVTVESEPKAFTVRVEAERGGSRRAVDFVLTASRAPDALYFVTDRIERRPGR
ncbi:general secretion pathway protein GspK [Chenggangzhangella methanolivorans]|uniref:General secretion pathway protein GspK n=1 Tax=Chenggangzhangella methanolivorans TaxID=1437009 RepID=A0A9E6RIV5_9HYPH|nr:general secretion pathway protein GspK [Chenggangzhangella methanolivorans]QZO01807.1 general secretion pathway protein GspK [Chenggangzhangella methanolivorans]